MLSSTFKKLLPRRDELVMDRFIPSNASHQAYRARSNPVFPPYGTGPSDTLAAEDTSLFHMNEATIMDGFTQVGQLIPSSEHRDSIAQALDYHRQNRVLTFGPQKSTNSSTSSNNSTVHSGSHMETDTSLHETSSPISSSSMNSPSTSMRSFADTSGMTALPGRVSMDSDTSFGSSPAAKPRKKRKLMKSTWPFRILDAPCLRNDFYANLISWSKQTENIAVGLGSNVFIWSELEGHTPLNVPQAQTVSCVSFSDGDLILVASREGHIGLYSQKACLLLHEDKPSEKAICCITWVPGSNSNFFVGDEAGHVLYFEIQNGHFLHLVQIIKCHQQQVCGIAINSDLNEITVGGNDNCCTIWDITDIHKPVMKFYLGHQAAVKAVAYCPWAKSLLATGGGSKDKTIRFWHTTTGTLLGSYKTKGQITSLIWSKKKRQILATFGFGDSDKPVFISILSYPELKVLEEVKAAPNHRALSAVLSPDASSICVASNDETVRFYQFWDSRDPDIVDSKETGVLGSEIIELHEGITNRCGFIR